MTFSYMKKNPAEIFEYISSHPITGDYILTIPEQVMNEMQWYEDTKIRFTIEGNDVILSE